MKYYKGMFDDYKYRDNNRVAASGGIGFSGLLTILFIAFKLLGIIDWSWVWVLSPIWISAALVIVVLIIIIVVSVLIAKDF